MNLCFINLPIEFYSPISGGAIATVIAETSRQLIQAGHQVTVLTPTNGDALYEIGRVVPLHTERRNDLSFIRRRWSGVIGRFARYDWPYYEFYLRSVLQALRGLQPAPDAIIMFNDFYLPARVKQVLPRTRVGLWLQNECRSAPIHVSKTISATDLFLTCSQYIADWTAAAYQIPVDRFQVAQSGVNQTAFFPRTEINSTSQAPKVLFVGRLDRNKGPDLAATAVAALQAQHIDVSLTVAGGVWFYDTGNTCSDPFLVSLTNLLQQINATSLGHVVRSALPQVVRDHDIVCVLSRSNEPFGLVVLEAMASGCAVIASNRGGLPEACGEAAILVDPDDQPAIESALKKLVTDPQHLAEQKKRSTQRAAHAGWDLTAKAVARLWGDTTKLPVPPMV